jgi:hypothetical protein
MLWQVGKYQVNRVRGLKSDVSWGVAQYRALAQHAKALALIISKANSTPYSFILFPVDNGG